MGMKVIAGVAVIAVLQAMGAPADLRDLRLLPSEPQLARHAHTLYSAPHDWKRPLLSYHFTPIFALHAHAQSNTRDGFRHGYAPAVRLGSVGIRCIDHSYTGWLDAWEQDETKT